MIQLYKTLLTTLLLVCLTGCQDLEIHTAVNAPAKIPTRIVMNGSLVASDSVYSYIEFTKSIAVNEYRSKKIEEAVRIKQVHVKLFINDALVDERDVDSTIPPRHRQVCYILPVHPKPGDKVRIEANGEGLENAWLEEIMPDKLEVEKVHSLSLHPIQDNEFTGYSNIGLYNSLHTTVNIRKPKNDKGYGVVLFAYGDYRTGNEAYPVLDQERNVSVIYDPIFAKKMKTLVRYRVSEKYFHLLHRTVAPIFHTNQISGEEYPLQVHITTTCEAKRYEDMVANDNTIFLLLYATNAAYYDWGQKSLFGYNYSSNNDFDAEEAGDFLREAGPTLSNVHEGRGKVLVYTPTFYPISLEGITLQP